MPREEYQGVALAYDELARTGSRVDTLVQAHGRDNREIFSLTMSVTYSYAGAVGIAPEELSRDLALRWAPGLIDLERYEEGGSYEQHRDTSWAPTMSPVSDTQLSLDLLRALLERRFSALTANVDPWLDVQGIADVLGVATERVISLLRELAVEGFVHDPAELFGKGIAEGRCSITNTGMKEWTRLSAVTAPRPSDD